MIYLLYDLETTGLERREPDQILQIAGVIFDTEKQLRPEDMPYCSVIVDQGRFDFEPYAATMNAWLMQEVVNHRKGKETQYPVMPPNQAYAHVAGFISKHSGGRTITAVGKNLGAFDLQFTPEVISRLFHYQFVDIGSLFLNLREGPKGLGSIKKKCGITGPVSHDALYDCRDYAHLMQYKLESQKLQQSSQGSNQ